MYIAITGASGYLGSHLRAHLDRGSNSYVAVPRDLLLSDGLADWLRAAEVDAVVHLAAVADVGEAERHPEICWSVNVGGTANVMTAARAAGVRRVVVASTVLVYGAHDQGDIGDTCAPVGVYALSKLAAERIVIDRADRPGLAVILRLTNLIGPTATGTLPRGVTGVMARTAVKGETMTLRREPGTGAVIVRDFLDVRDAVDAVLAAVESPLVDVVTVVNVGTGKGRSLTELTELFYMRPDRVNLVDATPGEPRPFRCVGRFDPTNPLGWSPTTSIESTVANLLAVARA